MNRKILLITALLILLLTFFYFFVMQKKSISSTYVNTENKTLVESIRTQIQAIDSERKYEIKILNNEKFIGNMTDGGGQLVGNFKDGKIFKITERLGLSYGVMTYEYYFLNEVLIFVNEKEEDFPDLQNTGTLDYSNLESIFTGEYYFNNNKLIFEKFIGKKKFSDNSDNINMESLLLKWANENIKLLKMQNN